VRAVIEPADLAVTNLETAINAGDGWPVRDTTSHIAPEEVLDTLSWLGFRAISLASNHAFDLGPPGIIAALDATRRRRVLTAGSGLDASGARQPGFAEFAGRRVALVGVVAAENPPGSHALDAVDGVPARPGVNRLRVAPPGGAGEDVAALDADVEALLSSVRRAAAAAEIVLVYLHNHYWATPQHATPRWVRTLAKQCVDAGASVFFGHGTPAMQGFEFHRGHLIAYGLGSLVFHTHKPESYDQRAWESALLDIDVAADGTAREVRLRPLVHGRHPDLGELDGRTDSPTLASPERSRAIAARLHDLSKPFGTTIDIAGGDIAHVRPASA
jgi:poly-gamma-glutamate synthesis protein (capsule biosynthesis protein)